VDRIKKLSLEILEGNKTKFGTDFRKNKKTLEEISIVRSKGLKNEVAGYITKCIKHELHDKKLKEEKIAKAEQNDNETEIIENSKSVTIEENAHS